MSRSELWINWIVSAIPLLYIVFLFLADMGERTYPWNIFILVALFYLKEIVATKREELRTRYNAPITKRQGLLMVIAIPLAIGCFIAFNWFEGVVGREVALMLLFIGIAVLWIVECVQAWRKYASSFP